MLTLHMVGIQLSVYVANVISGLLTTWQSVAKLGDDRWMSLRMLQCTGCEQHNFLATPKVEPF